MIRMLPAPKEFDDGRNQRDAHDGDNNEVKIPLHDFILTKPVASDNERNDPRRTPGNAVANESPKLHLGDARDERREGSKNWSEARNDDRLAAVPLVKSLRAQ